MADSDDRARHEPGKRSSQAPSPYFQAGDVILGQFEVVRIIGRGGMGVVYEVMDAVTHQRLALKMIRRSRLRKAGVRESFIQEVTLARKFRHPNIVAVYDVRQEGDLLFFTMEYLEGVNLREKLREEGTLKLQEAADILRALCDALDHAHRVTVHRDLSPENVMLTPEGVKLLDFGIAKLLDGTERPHRAPGKAPYTAPEQYRDAARTDVRADIYALGALFGEMLLGHTVRPPMDEDTSVRQLHPASRALIEKAMAPVEERYRNVGEFREALEACVDSAGAEVSEKQLAADLERVRDHLESPNFESHPSQGFPIAQWVLVALLLILAMAAPWILAYVLRERRTAPPPPPPPATDTADPARRAAPARAPQPAPASQYAWEEEDRTARLDLPGASMGFLWAPRGFVTLGDPSGQSPDAPPLDAQLTRGFWVGRTEVTQGQWAAVMNTRPWEGEPEVLADDDAPAVYVSHHDARRFIDRLNAATGGGFALPTEAQWEYACKAGTRRSVSPAEASETLQPFAWCYENTKPLGEGYAHRVATRESNAWGLYDMHGNAAEWCGDWYHPDTWRRASATDPAGPASGEQRVVRGGSWESLARQSRCSDRAALPPGAATSSVGFRVFRTR